MIPRVMCIEDDKVATLVLKIALNQSGFCSEVLGFPDGLFAVEYLEGQLKKPFGEQRLPGLIFLDLNMPQMDGWEFLEFFQDNFAQELPELRVVVLTSSLYPEDRNRVLRYPFVLEFISKPIRLDILDDLKQNPVLECHFRKMEMDSGN